jgi:predicted DNA-binding protein (UPF0251 family)
LSSRRKDKPAATPAASDPLDFLEKLSPAESERLDDDVLRDHISVAEPDEFQIAFRNVTARRDHVEKLVTEFLKKKTGKRIALRKKVRLSKSQTAILAAARLTTVQETYWRLRFEHGLTPTEIARRLVVHHSTVQESLDAADKKIDRVKLRQARR